VEEIQRLIKLENHETLKIVKNEFSRL